MSEILAIPLMFVSGWQGFEPDLAGGKWIWNPGWGVNDEIMRGWLYVQGCPQMGIFMTWHVHKCNGKLKWVCFLWKWLPAVGQRGWFISQEKVVNREEVHWKVEPWMIHCVHYDDDPLIGMSTVSPPPYLPDPTEPGSGGSPIEMPELLLPEAADEADVSGGGRKRRLQR